MLSLLAEDAVSLTLPLVGTHAPADGRQVAAVVDYRHGIAEVALGKLGNPVGNVIADGATLFTARHLAFQAALSLADCLGESVAFVYFFKVLGHFVIRFELIKKC